MLRIASFNIENLDGKPGEPELERRAKVLRNMLNRLDADILCLQEVHGQELPGHTSADPVRELIALDFILEGTKYENRPKVSTLTSSNVVFDQRNLVVVSAHPIVSSTQHRNSEIDKLQYRKVTAIPAETDARDVTWERPIQRVEIDVPNLGIVHVLNLHLKSRLASNIKGQREGRIWQSAAGWAEGYFLSSIKRVGQALETRILVDKIFDDDGDAKVVVCGDFNAEPGEVPVEAICGRVENTDNSDLRERVLVPCSNGIGESIRYSHLHHGEGNLLDHMLISQTMLPHFRRAEIYNENLHDESLPFRFDTKFPESDHAGFVASFE